MSTLTRGTSRAYATRQRSGCYTSRLAPGRTRAPAASEMTIVLVALLLTGGSVLVGCGLGRALGDESPVGLQAAVGLAAVVIVARLALRLPGGATTSAIVMGLLLI